MSLHRLMLLLLALAVVLPFGRARAEDATSTPINYQFDDDLVDGTVRSPLSEVLFVRTRPQRESLVRAREHWLPELFRSVEDL